MGKQKRRKGAKEKKVKEARDEYRSFTPRQAPKHLWREKEARVWKA